MKILFSFFFVYLTLCVAKDCSYDELIQEMRELRRTVEEQRIVSERQQNQIEALQNIVASQTIELKTVKSEVEELKQQRTENRQERTKAKNTLTEMSRNMSTVQKDATKTKEDNNKDMQKGRTILNQPSGVNIVAFYAYMSSPMKNVGEHHTLIFDHAVTNVGNHYHPNSGVFIAPTSGLYAFSWSIRIRVGEYHDIDLAVNGKSVGVTHHWANSDEDHHSGATVIVQVSQGDDVFLRTSTHSNVGGIWSDSSGQSSFTGWKL
ncbi:hypothetical protein FSP39_013775 [Pinctada imbricata]|uniref:C1q domain-containing protein n=1 Tax=Pinctada imbricata TaxID=66713 RepID=A0AA88YUV6_PINIB|nr:hypothetical protein FSP39_013775 [Pinctada imbricata]